MQPRQYSSVAADDKGSATVAIPRGHDEANVLPDGSRPGVVFYLTRSEILTYSPCEWNIIGLLCEGNTQEQIRTTLGLNQCGIKRHLYNIRKKAGADSTSGVIAKLRSNGWVA